jgi:hypothetical protein
MPATKVNLSQMVDLAVGTPEVGAVNCNVTYEKSPTIWWIKSHNSGMKNWL